MQRIGTAKMRSGQSWRRGGSWLLAAGLSLVAAVASAQQGGATAPADDDPRDEPLMAAADGPTGSAANTPGRKPKSGSGYSEFYSEHWWTLSQPSFELHGHMRVRSELFHNFALGRFDPAAGAFWPRPADDDYRDTAGGGQQVKLCGADPRAPELCRNSTQAGANMRLRLTPTLHISDNLRINAQIDLLDNLVLGSTPNGYANAPSTAGGYQVVSRGGYDSLGALSTTQWAPVAGINSTRDSITVKRAWGEYKSPFGTLRFGRMPDHWGLGMLINAGNGHDSDWQSTADRMQVLVAVPDWQLLASATWDFSNEGAISAVLSEQQGQPYDLARKDDADSWVFRVARVLDPQLRRLALARGEVVVNGGGLFTYRAHEITNEATDNTGANIGQDPRRLSDGYVRRRGEVVVPDVWFQMLYKTFRLEMEAALIYGSLENTQRSGGSDFTNTVDPANDGWRLFQFGFTGQAEWRTMEDRLRFQLGFGLATGDSDVDSLVPQRDTTASFSSLQPQRTLDRTYSTFRFHPNYRVDLIFFRNILTRVQGAYYLRPQVSYEAVRDPSGHRFGGGLAGIWSRASEPVQAPGHAPDLGVELDLNIHYEWRPNAREVTGPLNAPSGTPGFFSSLQYGVFVPLAGLDYLPGQVADYAAQPSASEPLATSLAHSLRWQLGVMF